MFDITTVIQFLRKNFKLRDFLIIFGIIALFFFTRTVNLHNFPIFSDEGIYIRWAKTAKQDPAWRFISLTDGRQPLQTWVTMVTLKAFPEDALVAGRLFAVIAGFAGLTGLFTLLFYLFGKKAAYIGAFLYIFTPYFLFYDRIALIDSAVNASCVWILFFSILLVKTLRLDVALLFGLLSGVALLSKSTAQLFIGLSLCAPIVTFRKRIQENISPLVNYVFLYGVVVTISFIIYNIQRLSPFFHYINEKNHTFILTFSEWIHNPFALFWSNIQTVPTYAFWEMGWILPFIAILGFIQLFKKNKNLTVYLLTWILVPYLVISFFNKIIFPRYLLFFASLFVIPAAYFLSQSKNKVLSFILVGFFFLSALFFDYPILFQAHKLLFPPVDRGQYVEGITAVWGADELVQMIRERSTDKPAIVLAEGDFGLVGDVLNSYLKPTDRIDVKGTWPLTLNDILKQQENLKDHHIFVVFSHTQVIPQDYPLTLIKKFTKPSGDKVLYLFEYQDGR